MRAHDIENVGLSRVLDNVSNVPQDVLLRMYHLEQVVSDLTFEITQMQKQLQRLQ